jgi:hypothetical protein
VKYDKKFYMLLLIVGGVSVGISLTIPTTDILKGIMASPAVVALFIALYQILKSQSEFEKKKYFDTRRRVFEIGATSHMANTTFDKHVEFCEEYMKEVNSTVGTLFREGPSKEALTHANKSYMLRQKFAAWLTKEINLGLGPYEQVVREIGAWAGFVDQTRESPQYAEMRSQKINEIYKKFSEVLNLDNKENIDEVYAIELVQDKIREILGIEELTKIRKYLIKEAVESLESRT